jgi:hypothetical protein
MVILSLKLMSNVEFNQGECTEKNELFIQPFLKFLATYQSLACSICYNYSSEFELGS